MEYLLGFVIGVAIGATGVGGGVVTAPALLLVLGFRPQRGVATALAFSAVVKTAAAAVHLWRRNVDFRILGLLLAGGLPGAILGSLLVERFRGPGPESLVLIIVGATVAVSAGSSLYGAFRNRAVRRGRERTLPYISFPIGMEVGFSSAGAGALGTVLLFSFTMLPPMAVVGTDLVYGMMISAAGAGTHALAGSCDWTVLGRLAPAGIAGTLAGIWGSAYLPARTLRVIVLAWAALLGIVLMGKGAGQVI